MDTKNHKSPVEKKYTNEREGSNEGSQRPNGFFSNLISSVTEFISHPIESIVGFLSSFFSWIFVSKEEEKVDNELYELKPGDLSELDQYHSSDDFI
ncbi:hypothetical protein [Wolbachia endosymbiont of Ctenocephalides felis wCfeT]|uniref:hypothetical protein n=1 Tax=Wolbachia endosymbiont of Ctenocephalides felis wCfeT TaxID=2732593 RepID=UPI001444F43D|nr:hypothetical protein [Wolbachia endosymbiont of Ctenocephalides felis wCfeT]